MGDVYVSIPWKETETQEGPMLLDIYPPPLPVVPVSQTEPPKSRRPTLIYFHGGGMTVGTRSSWFPSWLQKRVNAAGLVFVSVDYSLLPPATGHQVVQDIIDLFAFISSGELDQRLDDLAATRAQYRFHIRSESLAVSGSSSGGLCAYLAAMHASPRPIALLSMYGMGGHFLAPHYLEAKTQPFFRGREILDPVDYREYLYPQSLSLPSTHQSPLSYHDSDWVIPGFPANPRMLLARLYLQLGVYLDYWTGEHQPSLSATLSDALATNASPQSGVPSSPNPVENLRKLIPVFHLNIFPQFNVNKDWPPTILCHGEKDTAVPMAESKHLYTLLQEANVPVQMEIVPGAEHSFDYERDAEVVYGPTLFDRISRFLITTMTS